MPFLLTDIQQVLLGIRKGHALDGLSVSVIVLRVIERRKDMGREERQRESESDNEIERVQTKTAPGDGAGSEKWSCTQKQGCLFDGLQQWKRPPACAVS